ncbi:MULTISPECIES: hypothetical protein [Tenebrionibacter/Tenebrionicola group]|jgi:hypothetical protein|uniref:Uncharacterized protein n=2 Tax=Tenebrionibacter/Tenebrionicola group TaxID=2969848 RepID=A0A8K0XXJ8_9ENTR|nr:MULTISPECIES: hypothetical protein [Tenebrionibacter/Tenebrionicola group]MBK4715758.1 hypothetical protein [Tenebrionibacter intestinalis]MBV5096456.1 hypothetical protein [Tenebrionicola larvae]
MIKSLRNYEEWTLGVVGKKLLQIKGLIYSLDVPDFEHPQQLQLVFSKAVTISSLKCGKDGSTLVLTEHPMQEKELGEYGKETIIDISHIHPFANFIEKTLLKVFLIFSSVEDAYVGLRLDFENHLSLIIMNIGDEINIFEALSTTYEQIEGIRYSEL